MLKLHGRSLPIDGFGDCVYQALCSVSVSPLQPYALPRFTMGFVCPVHALHGPAPVGFDPLVKNHQPSLLLP